MNENQKIGLIMSLLFLVSIIIIGLYRWRQHRNFIRNRNNNNGNNNNRNEQPRRVDEEQNNLV